MDVQTDPDGVGTLLRTREPNAVTGTPLQFVRVTRLSTGRIYHLSVPPQVRTARAAVVWTFGKEATPYAPTMERYGIPWAGVLVGRWAHGPAFASRKR